MNFLNAAMLAGVAASILGYAWLACRQRPPARAGAGARAPFIGSMNADTFLRVRRLPKSGENLTLLPGCVPIEDVPGGKVR